MQTIKSQSKAALWAGRIVSVLVILFLLVDGGMKLVKAKPSMDGSAELGIPLYLVPILGAVLLICTILYAIPRTALLGAVLLTAYLGGAVAIMLIAKQPIFFPIVFAALAWLGLYLSGEKLKGLVVASRKKLSE